jgi:chemotaxis protein MotB
LPIAPNDSPEGKAKNRRTEIIITPNLGELAELIQN